MKVKQKEAILGPDDNKISILALELLTLTFMLYE